MKIAFDGTVLHGRKSGVGYYCEELLKAMLAANHEDEFHVFSHLPLNLQFPSSNGNLRFTNSVHFPVRAVYLHALLPRVLDKVNPDICHYTNFLAPISEERPYVVTIHDMGLVTLRDSHPWTKRLYTRRLTPLVAHKARLIITNSEYSKWQIVRHLGISEDRIRVTPLAAGPEFRPVPVRPPAPYFLYVGNLEPRKNLHRLVEAFARIPQKDHELVIVGNPWYHGEEAKHKAKSLGIDGRVKFPGYVPREDLPGLFSGATAFVYPSLLEGFGLPVVEAMACGAPVITSNNSSMKEIGEGAALLVDPRSVSELTDALSRVAEDDGYRSELSRKGIARAAQFSWQETANRTLAVYHEAANGGSSRSAAIATPAGRSALQDAIEKTVQYSNLFQYPLQPDELRERLFDVRADETAFNEAMSRLQYAPRQESLEVRVEREAISDRAIAEMAPHLRTLASIPFVRMIAFSGATAHRNMRTAEDVDLFMVVEDGKLWAVFLIAMLWAKVKGLRKRLCMNYGITDAALPLFEHDRFTAHQAASLKPIFGKDVYDRFIAANPFIKRCLPNFEVSRHRERYPEIQANWGKKGLEQLLKLGFVQVLERLSCSVLSRYLAKKTTPDSDVVLDPRRMKLHLRSHKRDLLSHL